MSSCVYICVRPRDEGFGDWDQCSSRVMIIKPWGWGVKVKQKGRTESKVNTYALTWAIAARWPVAVEPIAVGYASNRKPLH